MAAVPVLPAYSVSKAASLSLTQSLRPRLAGRGVSVQAVLPGPIGTDMVRDLPIPKIPPESVAHGRSSAKIVLTTSSSSAAPIATLKQRALMGCYCVVRDPGQR